MLNFCLYKPCAMCLSLLHFQPCAGNDPDCNCCLSNKYTYMQLRSPEVTRGNFHLTNTTPVTAQWLRASQQEGPGFDSRMGRCWYWGAGSPQAFSALVGYLPGLSVWSLHVLPVFTRGFPHKEPQQKKMQKNITLSCPSLTKTDMIT